MNKSLNNSIKESVELTPEEIMHRVQSVHVPRFVKGIQLSKEIFNMYASHPVKGMVSVYGDENRTVVSIDPRDNHALWSLLKYKFMIEPLYGSKAYYITYNKFDFRDAFRWVTCNNNVLKLGDFMTEPVEQMDSVMKGVILAVAETLAPHERVTEDALRNALEDYGVWNLLISMLDIRFLECQIKTMEVTTDVEE